MSKENYDVEDTDYWIKRWIHGKTEFHSSKVEFLLKENLYLLTMNSNEKQRILVPLCGKSLDMLYLYEQGFCVIGVEISEIAIQQFFEENHKTYQIEKYAGFNVFKHDEKLTIIQGDFFKLTKETIQGQCDYLWDKEAIVAVQQNKQKTYVNQLKMLLKPNCKILLESFEKTFNDNRSPHMMNLSELKCLFGEEFLFKEISRIKNEDMPPYIQKLKGCIHVLYFIKRQINKSKT